MSNISENYSLEVVSQSKDSQNKIFKKHKLHGMDTIGVFDNEPFEILFTNKTYATVQVKITLDGLDILTGELATSAPTTRLWTVKAKETLSIKAFPETHNGGAQLLFTHKDKSVALHTHGNLSNQGIIAAAVYIESDFTDLIEYFKPKYRRWVDDYYVYPYHHYQPTWIPSWINNDLRLDSFQTYCINSNTITSNSIGFNGSNTESYASNAITSEAGIGAGSYVEQHISQEVGLRKPLLSNIISIKYMWFDALKSLMENNVANIQPTGFPMDKPLMNLGSTPRQNTDKITPIQIKRFNA